MVADEGSDKVGSEDVVEFDVDVDAVTAGLPPLGSANVVTKRAMSAAVTSPSIVTDARSANCCRRFARRRTQGQ